MNDMTIGIASLVFGLCLGWMAFGMNLIQDCERIGAFTVSTKAYTCQEVKK